MSNHLSFDCIIDDERCSKCCEVIHLSGGAANIIKDGQLYEKDWVISKHWTPLTRRQAKKKNPYMFGPGWRDNMKGFLKSAEFFRCTALIGGVCSVYDDRPHACRDFAGNGAYAFECAQEYYEKSQIIATDRTHGVAV